MTEEVGVSNVTAELTRIAGVPHSQRTVRFHVFLWKSNPRPNDIATGLPSSTGKP